MMARSLGKFKILLILSFIFAITFVPAVAQEKKEEGKKKDSEEDRLIKAIDKVKKSVVRIDTKTEGGGSGIGSGVILTTDGYIITNLHVLRNSEKITVTIYNGKKFHAVVAGKSPRNDLAVLKINSSGLKVPRWGDSRKLEIGQIAVAIGNPFKFEGSVSRGIISALDRRIAAAGIIYKDLIQTDAAINPGNSGGALIDSRGTVIGINTLIYTGSSGYSAQGLGFAIPIHRALAVARKLMSRKVFLDPRPWIGVQGINITREMAEMNMLPVNMGVLITEVQSVSPAERGGLRQGDIVVQADGELVRNIEDLKGVLNKKKPGEDLILRVWRGEKRITITIKVSQRSVAP